MAFLVALALFLQEPDLPALVRDLDNEKPAVRERAGKELKAYLLSKGPAAPALIKSLRPEGVEAKTHLEVLASLIDSVEACRKRLSVFDLLDPPDCRGRKFILYTNGSNIGKDEDGRYRFMIEYGWLLSESERGPLFLGTTLGSQLASFQQYLPEDWETARKNHPADRPIPGIILETDFEKFCRAALQAWNKVDEVRSRFLEEVHPYPSGIDRSLQPALLAYWALQRGLPVLAVDLEAAALKEWNRSHNDDPAEDTVEPLRGALANLSRENAIGPLYDPPTRTERLRFWKAAAVLSKDPGEAKRMIALYQTMLREDAEWKTPEEKAFAALPRAKQAARWIHELRDADTWANVSEDPEDWLQNLIYPDEASACGKLYALGWDALPALLEHLDDVRPTNHVVAGKEGVPNSLLRVGDFCAHLFAVITGQSLFPFSEEKPSLVVHGDPVQARKTGMEWWEKTRPSGEEAFYLNQSGMPERACVTACHLLRIDSAKHLTRVYELLSKSPPKAQRCLLRMLRPFLDKSREPMVAAFLKSGDPDLQIEAAKALWRRYSSEAGLPFLMERLRKGQYPDQSAHDAVNVLAEAGKDWITDAFCEMARDPDFSFRWYGMNGASMLPCRKSADAIVACLDRRQSTGITSAYTMRECDIAAEDLLELLGRTQEVPFGGTVETRDQAIAALRDWWAKNRETLDWAELRRKRLEELRPLRDRE